MHTDKSLICEADDRGRGSCEFCCMFFVKKRTAWEFSACLVGSEMCIGDSWCTTCIVMEVATAGVL